MHPLICSSVDTGLASRRAAELASLRGKHGGDVEPKHPCWKQRAEVAQQDTGWLEEELESRTTSNARSKLVEQKNAQGTNFNQHLQQWKTSCGRCMRRRERRLDTRSHGTTSPTCGYGSGQVRCIDVTIPRSLHFEDKTISGRNVGKPSVGVSLQTMEVRVV